MSTAIKEQLKQWLTDNQERGIKLLQQFVQAKSTQGNEKGVQQLVREELQRMGLEVDVWEPDGRRLAEHPFFASPRKEFSGSPNVVGVLKGTGGGRSIILNGHVDVVPEGDLQKWNYQPYSGKLVDGKIYGRGTTDMKGGNVSLLLAMQAIQALGIRLKGDVLFESVIEEESGGAGTLAAILRGYRADAALIPEPTNLKIFPKQQGSMWFRIYVKGQSAHGGTRYEGVSAIEKSMSVMNHILQLEKIRNERVQDPLYNQIPIPFPINIGKISGGDWPSSVADFVQIEGRIGVSPEETMDEAKEEMAKWIERLKEIDPWFEEYPPQLEWFGARWLPGAIEQEHKLMNILVEKFQDVLDEEPVIEASPWGTDGGLLTAIGDTPTIVFGPGVTELAHHSDEYIEIEKIFIAAEIIALTLLEWCEIANASLSEN
ncbi:acetylornithine deacetylase [Robertmurraya siralis]|uniref:Acetylornithine deacetylase n=1 Tax=Robertmurraya siralis TaxID=77777 RepID=A0A920BUC5_9BACI|nr:peptidase [Robertmurraya siralis]GIN62839.1 acetylornithine deacetylase [Robertmurraya siralis]